MHFTDLQGLPELNSVGLRHGALPATETWTVHDELHEILSKVMSHHHYVRTDQTASQITCATLLHAIREFSQPRRA